ncbi:hypothetical protein [Flavivirga rizhaonensis]|uniref:Uncharacterized protein n=1 Tax=Flavivirga rizhaonensis TaxID=2559571 RepID=A0A4S1E2Q2_9FLAO|nr:hypothetical protein [Flavivirga rizhaonensis]TGV04819.1 hypothetical protein EM932_01485 [Flavivirga rizhaonensis]
MKEEIINCYQLDIKQDFPEGLRVAQEECKSLKRTNEVLATALIIVGLGLLVSFVFSQIVQRPVKEEPQK